MIKRASIFIAILGLVLLWFGVNQDNQIFLLVSLVLIFVGVGGFYWGINNMRGSRLLKNNNLILVSIGVIGLVIVLGIFLGK